MLRSNREQGKHTPCKSENAGDFNYRACAPFCSVEKAEGHCDFCKCSDCPYCLAGDETMATLAAAKVTPLEIVKHLFQLGFWVLRRRVLLPPPSRHQSIEPRDNALALI